MTKKEDNADEPSPTGVWGSIDDVVVAGVVVAGVVVAGAVVTVVGVRSSGTEEDRRFFFVERLSGCEDLRLYFDAVRGVGG